MRYKINTGLLVIFILIISVFISNLANFVSIDKQIAQRLEENLRKNDAWRSARRKVLIENGTDHLMWFVQISDLHISYMRDKGRQSDLKEFVTKTIDVIKPPVVIASGDLTDARSANHLGSEQFESEWQIYKRILDEAKISDKTLWMDIRGNHDTFNVPSMESGLNFFTKYSIQGGVHKQSYMKQITIGSDKYSFIAIDACQTIGTKRPFNFIGILDVNQTNAIIDMAEESRKSGADYIIWFGHYPTSTILSPGTGNRGLKGILGQYDEGYVYMSGHLHTLGGMVPQMYAIQDTGFLELELGDWKDNRMYRVAVFDHGLFSFVDVKHASWPVILITNPKHAQFNMPTKEDPLLQLESTHIRILVFDPRKIIACKVRINKEEFKSCTHVSSNLYTRPWDPSKYKTGYHKIEVQIKTDDGNSATAIQPFSLDGSRKMFSIGSLIVLKSDYTKLFQSLFGIALTICILPLCILRIWHELVYAKKVHKPDLYGTYLRRCVRKLWILSTVDRLFIPIMFISFYILVGPWSVGHVVDGHIGVIFSWGIFVNGHFIPGTLNYLYGYFQLMFCHFPLIIIYAHIAWERYGEFMGFTKKDHKTFWRRLYSHIPFFSVIMVEVMLAAFFYSLYGPLAAFFGPLRTWSIALNIAMYYWARTLPRYILKPAIIVVE